MTLQIHLSPELEAKLRKLAEAAGKDIEAFALEAVEKGLSEPESLAEILAPVHKAVKESGMSDEEVDALLEGAIAESRRERKHRI